MSFAYRGCAHGYPLKGSLAAMCFGMGECPSCDENGLPYEPTLKRVNEMKEEKNEAIREFLSLVRYEEEAE